jgi:hypothetical protein
MLVKVALFQEPPHTLDRGRGQRDRLRDDRLLLSHHSIASSHKVSSGGIHPSLSDWPRVSNGRLWQAGAGGVVTRWKSRGSSQFPNSLTRARSNWQFDGATSRYGQLDKTRHGESSSICQEGRYPRPSRVFNRTSRRAIRPIPTRPSWERPRAAPAAPRALPTTLSGSD